MAVAVVLLCVFPQKYIDPLLEGAVDWMPARDNGTAVQVRSGFDGTDPGLFWEYIWSMVMTCAFPIPYSTSVIAYLGLHGIKRKWTTFPPFRGGATKSTNMHASHRIDHARQLAASSGHKVRAPTVLLIIGPGGQNHEHL